MCDPPLLFACEDNALADRKLERNGRSQSRNCKLSTPLPAAARAAPFGGPAATPKATARRRGLPSAHPSGHLLPSSVCDLSALFQSPLFQRLCFCFKLRSIFHDAQAIRLQAKHNSHFTIAGRASALRPGVLQELLVHCTWKKLYSVNA